MSDSESSSSEVVAPLRGSSRRLPRLSVDPVQQLLAFEEIRQLPSRYALAVDSRNLDALAELFAPAHGPDQERFLSAMRGVLDDTFNKNLATLLFVGNHVIDLLDEDNAEGVVYCKCEVGNEERWTQATIIYEDSYVRVDGRWYFDSRAHEVFYGTESLDSPLSLDVANERIVGRGTIPFAWPTWESYYGSDEAARLSSPRVRSRLSGTWMRGPFARDPSASPG